MAGLPPGDPQLVSMIVSHLKTQGLFDQFRRECLADVDTKPAYLNLKQRVDNFVSNHLSNHTWSPHLNKNQLRNNIRQLVLQSGMLEQGVDRIVAQVVDPKINHIFRPQVERVVREFLSPGSCGEEPPFPLASAEMTQDCSTFEQASLSTPATSTASDAMSILDTISSLNQEASSRASSGAEKGRKAQASEEPMQIVEEGEQDMSLLDEESSNQEGRTLQEMEEAKLMFEVQAIGLKAEDTQEPMDLTNEGTTEEVKMEEEELGSQEQVEESKDKQGSKASGKPMEEKQDDEQLKSPNQIRQRARERLKEEYSLEDSDLEGLSDITVSSVHTSDLSSFEEETDDEQPPSDSSDDCEFSTDGERAEKKQASGDTGEEEKECKPRRKAYVHKPFLYSRYYSDSDDEVTVEERRRSAAKDKEERLLKRQQNRERMEEKRRQKATQAEAQDLNKQRGDSPGLDSPQAKEARKERKVLEKKMALNRKRKLDSRKEADVLSKKKGDPGGEGSKKAEMKSAISKTQLPKLIRKVSETSLSSERHRRQSGSVSEDSSDLKKLTDKIRTHSFILELEQGSQESLRQRSLGKFDRPPRKELHSKERKEKERSLSDERAKLKQRPEKKGESQVEDSQQKEGNSVKATFLEERGEKKAKVKGDKKMPGTPREGRLSMSDGMNNEGGQKDTTAKKGKAPFVDAAKAEKDKEKEKDKMREKDRVKDKEKEKSKGEKTSAKSEPKLPLRSDFTGSLEDRSDVEPGPDGGKKKDKHPKEVLKRLKSHSEDRQGDKPKMKSDSKDNEREKTKADQEGQKPGKSGSEMDKDLRRSKSTEKGRPLDKPKPKSREEAKTPSSSKTDKKAQSSEIKIKDVSISKHEAAKEKKKEGNMKELKKASEEKEKSQDSSQEKSEMKNARKKLEKRDKTSEKKDESHEDRKVSRGDDKSDKSEKSSRSSFSPSLEAEEPHKKPVFPQDVSTDSDPITATITTSFSDDTYDALSDITPEPEDGETELRLSELESRPLPSEADALLTLMDICTSADARLPQDGGPEIVNPEMTLQDADMKMKEAALTLLSMDPDSTLSPSLITPDAREDPEVNLPAQQAVDATTAVEAEQCASENVNSEVEIKPLTADLPPVEYQQIDQHVDEKPNPADASDKNEKEQNDSEVLTSALQDDSTISNVPHIPFDGENTIDAEITIEPKPVTKLTPLNEREATDDAFETKEAKEIIESTEVIVYNIQSEQQTKIDEVKSDVGVMETSTQVVETEEDNQVKMDIDNLNEVHNQTQDKGNVSQEGCDPQNIESDDPDMPEEVRETKLVRQSTLVKQTSSASDSDRHDDEKVSDLSEKEEKTEGRATRKRKHSSQKAATTNDSGEEKDDKESQEQPSAEETDWENIQEAKTPRRGRSSSKTTEVEEDQPKGPEKSEETPTRRGRCTGAQVKDTAAGKKKDEKDEAKEEKPSLGQQETEKEENGQRKDGWQRSQARSPSPQPEGITDAASSKSKESTNSSEPSLKRKQSDEVEESVEETQAKEVVEDKENTQQEQEERQPSEDHANLSEDPEGKEDCSSENKTDNDEEDQGMAPKKPSRRGRPSKGAAASTTEDSEEKKDNRSDEKESEQNNEEEDDEKEEEDTKTRTTTRSASRLEAERNKPSKPSTRASRQNGKEEATVGTRGTRGQAGATKGGRKREASPPAVRTRGAQKSEEPPSKRAKR
ncbi:biorientation of chromosomes in cell division protein 1-like 1 [Lampris incognitus]|uniref:biorientation of chromosomes in cell division protein 1-like 1 n=1 Tax=Lampris incognitus TaxID=2546036 RepID=UPI0024B5A632|nr:biorientation of chromosomes in cell division protein 1-like 1 [Lampris incognitus]